MQPFSPRLVLSYPLLDENSLVVLENTENIRDSVFTSNQSLRHKMTSWVKKKRLDDWLKVAFATLLITP
jgi:hypothetical protein